MIWLCLSGFKHNLFVGDTFDQWFLRVGCHTDVLQADDEYRRWPNITKVFPICTNVIRACSPFGGLVYFESPEGKSSLKAKLENVVECPYFDLCDQDSVNTWPHRKHAQGLWAELAGELITITLPSSAVRHVENPTQIVKLYDRYAVYIVYIIQFSFGENIFQIDSNIQLTFD